VLFLVGRWEGAGVVGYPTIESVNFGQEITFGQNGKPFLSYVSRTWSLGEDGAIGRPLASETGYWRPQPGGALEVLLVHPTGISEIYIGEVSGTKIELATDAVARTASAKEVTAGKRLYGLVEGDLAYAFDMAAVGQPLQPHVSARLKRVALLVSRPQGDRSPEKRPLDCVLSQTPPVTSASLVSGVPWVAAARRRRTLVAGRPDATIGSDGPPL
jgi:hypothetical protein